MSLFEVGFSLGVRNGGERNSGVEKGCKEVIEMMDMIFNLGGEK